MLVFVDYKFPGKYTAGFSECQDALDSLEYCKEFACRALENLHLRQGADIFDRFSKAEVFLENDYSGPRKHNLLVKEIRCVEKVGLDDLESTPELCAKLLIRIIDQDVDESHLTVLILIRKMKVEERNMAWKNCVERLIQYLGLPRTDDNPNILLKQQRAIISLADFIWEMKIVDSRFFNQMIQTNFLLNTMVNAICQDAHLCSEISKLVSGDSCEDEEENSYYKFLDPFLKACNLKELLDFEICADGLRKKLDLGSFKLRWNGEAEVAHGGFKSSSGMRIGLSSANASDNWTNAKLRYGKVLNVSVNLDGKAPVSASFERILNQNENVKSCPILVLKSTDRLSGNLSTSEKIYYFNDAAEADDLRSTDDPKDPLRMLKYALFFCGILNYDTESHGSFKDQIFNFFERKDITLKLCVENYGPSRSGFASSSAVSGNLLKVLFKGSGQTRISDDDLICGSMVLLFENQLGLKSGRQDIDGLLPTGLKSITYFPTGKFLFPTVDPEFHLKLNLDLLTENLLIVDTGIQRNPSLGRSRGLNMRHWALLSRDGPKFAAIKDSYDVHEEILHSLCSQNFALLGDLFFQYMDLRQQIDSGATSSIFDDAAGCKVLRKIFDHPKSEGLIYGGMFTGAMGGGVAMLVLTDKGKMPSQEFPGQTNIESYLMNDLKSWCIGEENIKPFANLRIFAYSINSAGIQCEFYPHRSESQ